jgi:hypothetical protein
LYYLDKNIETLYKINKNHPLDNIPPYPLVICGKKTTWYEDKMTTERKCIGPKGQ